jgi:hypothetical protein
MASWNDSQALCIRIEPNISTLSDSITVISRYNRSQILLKIFFLKLYHFDSFVSYANHNLCSNCDLNLNTCFNIHNNLLDHLCRGIETMTISFAQNTNTISTLTQSSAYEYSFRRHPKSLTLLRWAFSGSRYVNSSSEVGQDPSLANLWIWHDLVTPWRPSREI